MGFTHLHVHSNFSFLDGGSSVKQLLDRAKEVGCESLAVTDHNGLYGAVRFYDYAKKIGIKPIIGVELDLEVGGRLILLAKNMVGYSNLCKIITRAQLSHEKGSAAASLDTIREHRDELFALSRLDLFRNHVIPNECEESAFRGAHRPKKADFSTPLRSARNDNVERFIEIFGRENLFIELQNHMLPDTAVNNLRLFELAQKMGLHCVATNDVHYALKEDFKVHDVLVCVQTITTLDDCHPSRKSNAEYYLKSPRAMSELFKRYPESIETAGWIASQCNLDLNLGTYRFPGFPLPDGETAYSRLCKLCFDTLGELYKPITPVALERLQHELRIINELGFSEFFLAVWDIVRYARSKGIRCSGRGSAADSLVAYCLGITIADPIKHNLLFERFLNPERKGMPDIDIDFDAARRDEVIEYIYNLYGQDKVAMVCTVSTLRARSCLRDLGKAMAFAGSDIALVASSLPHVGSKRIREAIDKLPELKNANLPIRRLETLIETCEKVDNFPRHLSVHLGGIVVSRDLLTELVPLEWATKGIVVTQYDKDDIETLGLVKIDILGLRNLSAIEDALATIKRLHGIDLDIDNIPLDDEPTYEMVRTCNTVGCFQIESPGMRGLLGRLQPENFDDLTAQISLFRPGPMQADMIRPFIARRHGLEEITYHHPCLEPVLKETYGVILYQEQVISVSHALAGFTYGQSDSLRRAMTNDRSQEEMEKIREGFVNGACNKGVEREIAEEVFSKLRAFAAYGFCKAHAASFAKIAYQTAYLKTHYPAEFFAGILNNEPMGFYPANVIVEEARRLGIRLLGVDINQSGENFSVEYDENGTPGIRVSLSQIKDIKESEVKSIISARNEKPFTSLADCRKRTHTDLPTVENLINIGAFDEFGLSRAQLLWMLGERVGRASCVVRPASGGGTRKLDDGGEKAGLFNSAEVDIEDAPPELIPDLPEPTLHERVRLDYNILGLSAICHPMTFYREKLGKARVKSATDLKEIADGTYVRTSGVVVVCMRPPTKSGAIVVFITLEDETGFADCVVFPKVYEQYGGAIFSNPALIVEGRLQKMGSGLSVIVKKVRPLTPNYRSESTGSAGAKPFKERIRTAGTRSFVRSGGA